MSAQSNPNELKEVHTASNRSLKELSPELSVEMIQEAVYSAYAQTVAPRTNFAPLGCKNTLLYHCATENFRSALCAKGWEASNIEHVPCVYNTAEGLRISCSTDGGLAVGTNFGQPILREKGNGTLRLAGYHRDNTMTIPGFEEFTVDPLLKKLDALDFYYLLIHLDEAGAEIRIELSCPVFNRNGEVIGWSNRIKIPPISISNDTPVVPKALPEPDIKILRKAQ